MALNRLDEAKAMVEQAFAEGLDADDLHAERLHLAFIVDDALTQSTEIAWFQSHPHALGIWLQAVDAVTRGQDRRGAQLYRQAEELARSAKSEVDPRRIRLERATNDALVGRCPPAGAGAGPTAPIVAALCGNWATAQKLVEQPADGRAPEAERPLAYLRAHVLFARGRAKEAAAAFDAILKHKAAHWGAEYAAAHVGLARAAARDGDTARAKNAYESFFALWKDADADVPLLLAARKEYDKLQ
jgi:hypothetical protein